VTVCLHRSWVVRWSLSQGCRLGGGISGYSKIWQTLGFATDRFLSAYRNWNIRSDEYCGIFFLCRVNTKDFSYVWRRSGEQLSFSANISFNLALQRRFVTPRLFWGEVPGYWPLKIQHFHININFSLGNSYRGSIIIIIIIIIIHNNDT